MRTRKSSSDIRTTGFVQVDASRHQKRSRSPADWSFGNKRQRASKQVSQLEETSEADVHEASGRALEDGRAGGSPHEMCKESPDVKFPKKPEEKRSLRQFSRTRNQKSRRGRGQATEKKGEGSDASSNTADMVLDDEKSKPQEAEVARRSSRNKFVNMYQFSEFLLDDIEEIFEAKPSKNGKRAKQESASNVKKNNDSLDAVEDCLNFLEGIGLFKQTACSVDAPEEDHPGVVGDGSVSERCKVCGRFEDSSSMLCDTCEEIIHQSCCFPRIRTLPRDDRWLCSFCARKRKKRSAELKIFPTGYFDEKLPTSWKIDKTKVRGWDLQRMERTHVRVGKDFQAEVLEWKGKVSDEDLPQGEPGTEIPISLAQKERERAQVMRNISNNIWPKGWLPAKSLPAGEKENWIQCQNIMYEAGDYLPNGEVACKDMVCGKWRRAPLDIVADDGWECSCAIAWDPRHADCAVPQELSTEEIRKRPKARMQSPEEWRNPGKRKNYGGSLAICSRS